MNIMSPNLWGGVHIDFGADPVGVGFDGDTFFPAQ